VETPKASQVVKSASDEKETAKTEVADKPAAVTRKRSASAA
jgi:hypothetical protein